ncbi:MAG: hypothetical protein U5K31_05355 [Balneolaceae bacterium]|nr:hypothetical protein [Balneolaceae bacterium]
MRSLEPYRDQIEEFAKRNSLDFGEEPEVATMLKHYDSLIQQNSASNSGSDGGS